MSNGTRNIRKRSKLGRCPECGRKWFIAKKHPHDANTLFYACKKGHEFKRTWPTEVTK